jgi:hypothetical protein
MRKFQFPGSKSQANFKSHNESENNDGTILDLKFGIYLVVGFWNLGLPYWPAAIPKRAVAAALCRRAGNP